MEEKNAYNQGINKNLERKPTKIRRVFGAETVREKCLTGTYKHGVVGLVTQGWRGMSLPTPTQASASKEDGPREA